MPPSHRLLTTLALGLALTVPAFAKKDKEAGAAAPFNFSQAPAAQADAFVAVTRGGNLKKIKRLAVVNFSVEFLTGKSASVSTRGGYKSGGLVIPALDTVQAQAIADRLYDQLLADLKTTGVEVIPFDTIKVSKHFAKLEGAQHASPWLLENASSNSVLIGAHGMPVYIDNPERLEGFKAASMTFGTNTRLHEVMLCNEFNANLLSVNIVVDFADVKTGRFFTNIETSFAHYLPAKHTRYRFAAVGQPEFAIIALSQRLDSGNVPFVEGDSRTGKSTTLDGKVSEKTKATSVTFAPALYYRDSDRLARAANALFISAFAKERGTPPPESTGKLIE
ncbi:hypothetical protein ESB00_02185 [Oleiharenicola lentus]|uniref:Uncharacterized protein n=1 Tax=Oleiharenicola lentus TaxID=2508720 RepID=A0A4Q1C746_9BACT|nr:hypothetical protein [Oleiharenicola lentus]RXK54725.1 hypothetical protein ESB00_02185 [Oleiharenicola lentus]